MMVIIGCQSEESLTHEQYVVNGQLLYEEHCANCHGQKGEGLKKLYPSMTNNASLKDVSALTCLILNGRENNGAVMPANAKLYDLDIAQLTTYLQYTFLNADTIVTADAIKRYRSSCP